MAQVFMVVVRSEFSSEAEASKLAKEISRKVDGVNIDVCGVAAPNKLMYPSASFFEGEKQEESVEDTEEGYFSEELVDRLEKFAGKTIYPGRNVIAGYPVDVQDSEGSYVYMVAVDKDAATGLAKVLRKAGFSAKADKKAGVMVEELEETTAVDKLAKAILEEYGIEEGHFPGKLGTGERFAACVKHIMSQPGFKPKKSEQTPEEAAKAICASIGRAKYGKKGFAKLASGEK